MSAVVGLAGVLVVALAPSALADYLTVAGGLNQREWVTASQWYPTSFVPRADGRLIVFAENLCPVCGSNDGYPHLVTGYGQALSASNRFGDQRTPRNLDGMMAGHRLLASVNSLASCRANVCEGPIYELDPMTGRVLRKVGVAVNSISDVFDPVTQRLGLVVVHEAESDAPYATFDEMDLDDGIVRTMFRFDPMSEACNSTSCVIGWAAFDPSGRTLFTACVEVNYLCAWNRTGRLLYRIQTAPTEQVFTPGVHPYAFFYPTAKLFHDELLYLDELLNVWAVPHPSASAVPVQLARSAVALSPGQANRSPIQLSPNGDLIVPHDRAVMCLGACTRVTPAAGPGSPGHRSGTSTPQRPAHDAGGVSGPTGSKVTVAGPPAGPALQASTATQAQTSAQSAAQVGAQTSGQAAAKVAALPNAVGLVDVPQDDAAMAMHASLLAPAPTVLAARLAVAALALTVLAAAAAWSPLLQVHADSEQEKVR